MIEQAAPVGGARSGRRFDRHGVHHLTKVRGVLKEVHHGAVEGSIRFVVAIPLGDPFGFEQGTQVAHKERVHVDPNAAIVIQQ